MSNESFELFGWIGSAFFAICSLPQAILCIKNKNAIGISGWFLTWWFLGEIFTLMYVYNRHDVPLICNYILNLGFLIIIGRYKIWPKNDLSS